MINIEEITSRLKVPDHPAEIEGVDWQKFETQLGTKLPSDYKAFISTYGSGIIGEFLYVVNPFSAQHYLNHEVIRFYQDAYAQLHQEFPNNYPRPPYPEPGSFVTWGTTINGDNLFWLPDGEPESWKVGLQAAGPEEEITNLTFAEMLVELLENKLETDIFPKDFLSMTHDFQALYPEDL